MPTVLVTGANRGLGLEFVRQYLDDGWTAIATCRAPEAATSLKALADASDGRLTILALDVTDDASVAAAAAAVGDRPVDILINNAGIVGVKGKGFRSVDLDTMAEVIATNTIGPIRVTRAFVEHLKRGQRKLVVTISSGIGSLQQNRADRSIAYGVSKAAVNLAMRCAAESLAPFGIASVLIAPGHLATDMGGADAPRKPSEGIADVRRVIDSIGPEQNSQFLTYDGGRLPW